MSRDRPAFEGLGPLLRDLRIEHGLTQQELAERSGVSKSMLSLYEGGKQRPHLATLERLLAALEVRLAELAIRLEAAAAEPMESSKRRGPRRSATEIRRPERSQDETKAAVRDILRGVAVLLGSSGSGAPDPREEQAPDLAHDT